jgi:hypothetical protein
MFALEMCFFLLLGLSNRQSKSNGTSEYPNRICCHSRLLLFFFLTSLKKNLAHFFKHFAFGFPLSFQSGDGRVVGGLGGGGTNMIKREKKRCW